MLFVAKPIAQQGFVVVVSLMMILRRGYGMTSFRQSPLVLLPLLVPVGCGTALNSQQYQTMDCVALNRAVFDTSKQISTTAITLGNVGSYAVPFWALGGGRVKQALVDRNSRRLSDLQSRQEQMLAERRRRCG
ncbi:hypothetical protein SAZ10_28770 [Mesorhizobium sp. BAC0120]|uniref:hypothetical protein n=1 Tax=Mesorhizobium sp. BAC0120 TaxID=3090670 RepID=UPI00298D55A3|nr:hypothetical protein [Mesorhizobium sp. BAC0120]MDW6025763.1 hypothetical protein [Mesorhizobium sp. BAC0120]